MKSTSDSLDNDQINFGLQILVKGILYLIFYEKSAMQHWKQDVFQRTEVQN